MKNINYFQLVLYVAILFFLSRRVQAQIRFDSTELAMSFEKAKYFDRPVMVYISATWSKPCKRMEKDVFSFPAIAEYYNRYFVNFKLNEMSKDAETIDKFVKIKSFPTLLFFDSKGNYLYKLSGFRDAEEMLSLGNQIMLRQNMTSQPILQNVDSITENTSYSFIGNDGRFTLGMRGKRLMYGFPYPFSTSHFAIKSGEKIGSNYAGFSTGFSYSMYDTWFGKKKSKFSKVFFFLPKYKKVYFHKIRKKVHHNGKNCYYLNDTLQLTLGAGSLNAQISYDFDGFLIEQILTPVDSMLKDVSIDKFGQYYRITYKITNVTDTAKMVGLLSLFDTMMDNNDACEIEPVDFNFSKEMINKNIKSRKEMYFSGNNIPDRLLAYRSVAKTIDLTGDFLLKSADCVPPDFMYVGAWPYLHGVSWQVDTSRVRSNYYSDSAVLLKWLEQNVNPGQSLVFTMYYGLFNKGELELIPANTPITGRNEEGKRVEQDITNFSAEHEWIYPNETTRLVWSSNNPMRAKFTITNMNTKEKFVLDKNTGAQTVKLTRTTLYRFDMEKDGKILNTLYANVEVRARPVYKSIPIDGKFSIGSEKADILYGYSAGYSNSYFELHSSKFKITNSKQIDAEYVTAEVVVPLESNQKISDTVYYNYKSIMVTQILKKDTVSKNNIRVDYVIKNTGKNTMKDLKFKIINDLYLSGNDYAKLKLDTQRILLNTKLKGHKIIDNISFADSKGNNLFALNFNTKPAEIYYAQWYKFEKLRIDTSRTKCNREEDCGIRMMWEINKLSPNESVRYSTTYTIDGSVSVNYKYNNYQKTDSLLIFFDSNKFNINNEAESVVKNVQLNTNQLILIEGYTDFTNDADYNYDLSEKRTNSVKKFLISNGIDKSRILIKNYGENLARQNVNVTSDFNSDRSVKIFILTAYPKE